MVTSDPAPTTGALGSARPEGSASISNHRVDFLKSANAQVLQQTLRTLDRAWDDMKVRGFGFPRFKNKYRMRSFVFPQLEHRFSIQNPVHIWDYGSSQKPRFRCLNIQKSSFWYY